MSILSVYYNSATLNELIHLTVEDQSNLSKVGYPACLRILKVISNKFKIRLIRVLAWFEQGIFTVTLEIILPSIKRNVMGVTPDLALTCL